MGAQGVAGAPAHPSGWGVQNVSKFYEGNMSFGHSVQRGGTGPGADEAHLHPGKITSVVQMSRCSTGE